MFWERGLDVKFVIVVHAPTEVLRRTEKQSKKALEPFYNI